MNPPGRRPTSQDVAARAGVSRATVSMVLNGRVEGTVAPDTRERVLSAADELGYTRSAIALSLRSSRTRTIGVVTDEISTSPWAGRMIRAASQEAAADDYMVVTVDLSLRESDLTGALRLLAERQVDGLLYATMGRARCELPPMSFGPPTVLLNCEEQPAGDERTSVALCALVPDDRGGARRAARRLLDVGHRRIAMLTGDDEQVATTEREIGFRDAISEAMPDATPDIVRTGWQMSDGFRETTRLLARPEPPTALFCIRDRVAAGAIHAASVLGLSVPQDLSLIGFDDEDFFAEELTPPLTTIALPHEEMGQRAMRTLLDVLAPASGDRPRGVTGTPHVVECPLVERETVASPRGDRPTTASR